MNYRVDKNLFMICFLLLTFGLVDYSAAEEVAEKKDVENVQVEQSKIDKIYLELDILFEQGKMDDIVALLQKEIDSDNELDVRRPLFRTYISFMMWLGKYDDAEATYLNKVRTDAEVSLVSFDTIYVFYTNNGMAERALKWAQVLVNQPIGTDYREKAFEWVVSGCLSQKDLEGAVTCIEKYCKDFDVKVVAKSCINIMFNCETVEHVNIIKRLQSVFEKYGNDDEMVTAKNIAKLHSMYLMSDWDAITSYVPTLLKTTNDVVLQREFNKIFDYMVKNRLFKELDQVAETIIMTPDQTLCKYTRIVASREWCGVAVYTNNEQDFVSRLVKVETLGLSPERIFDILYRYFYRVVQKTSALKELTVFADSLLSRLEEDSTKGLMKVVLLDGYYMLKDYDNVIKVLDQGIPNRDDAWIKMTKAKVSADRALDEKRYDDAVRHYREFIDAVMVSADDKSHDPTSNIIHTKTMIVAKNLKRIGDIYKEAGKSKDEVNAMYKEAIDKYNAAIAEGIVRESPTGKYITEAIAELEGLMAK